MTIPKGWYEYVVVDGVDVARPGIYEWKIDEKPIKTAN
jgi:hypothetical protein